MTAIEDIAAERRRQIEAEGWTPEHDDNHRDGAMAEAAACYCIGSQYDLRPDRWPWHKDWWKPTTRRRNLIKAAALIVAEIERLDRAEAGKPVRAILGNGGDISAAIPRENLKMPVLFKARVMKDGAAYITAYGDRFEAKVKNNVFQFDMDRCDITTLRNILTAALAE